MNTDDIRQQVSDITRKGMETGEDVTGRVREVIENAAQSIGDATDKSQAKLSSVVSAAIDGASSAVSNAAPEEAESTLRKVVDGLGQGLQRTAQATKLAVEEQASGGKAFAQDDLKAVADDFTTLGKMFIETVETHAKNAMGQASSQVSSLRDHAARTMDGVRPELEDAAKAAMKDPVGLAGESAGAAVNLAREAAGSLFSAMGKVLGDAGSKINPPKQ